MDIKKFEINLKKVNTLKQNIDLTGEEISKLEIQLLKNYIQKMYEALAMEDIAEDDEDIVVVKKKKKKKKVVQVEEEPQEEETEKAEEPEKEITEEPVIEKKEYDEKLLALFVTDKGAELSDKLGSLPITDIKKAIGLNDRIFTINELFGGDKNLFNSTVDKLNGMSGFEEAKDYLLENIAEKYNWAEEDNIKKVKRFIKIVNRRFGN